jgi:hypothetical protein
MEGRYYRPYGWHNCLATTAYSEPQSQPPAQTSSCSYPQSHLEFNSHFSSLELIQPQMGLNSIQDECWEADAMLQQLPDFETVVSSVTGEFPAPNSIGCYLCHRPLAEASMPPNQPRVTVKQKGQGRDRTEKKNAKQKDRDTSERTSNEKSFANFLHLFGPRLESERQEMEQSYTKADKAAYKMHVSQAIKDSLRTADSRGLPQDKQNEVGVFMDKVRANVEQLQIEPERRRRNSKTCKNWLRGSKQNWCHNCQNPQGKKGCLRKREKGSLQNEH